MERVSGIPPFQIEGWGNRHPASGVGEHERGRSRLHTLNRLWSYDRRGGWTVVAVFGLGLRRARRKYVCRGKSVAVAQSPSRHRHAGLLPQLSQNVLTVVTGILAGKTSKGLGQDIVVMQRLQSRLACNVQPQAVHQMDVFGFQ